jgi:hypothetical protein
MKGALVFLAVFAIVLVITLGNTDIPPGGAIYDAFLPGTRGPASGYLVGESVDAVTLIIGVFNGVIFGFIAWLVFTLITMGRKKNQNVQQTVNVNVGEKKEPESQGKEPSAALRKYL